MYHTPRLIGKRCVITGGSRGIGLAIAELFAAHGAWCTLVGRDQAALDRAAAGLKKRVALAPAPATAPLPEGVSSPPPPPPLPQSAAAKSHSTVAMDVSHPGRWEELADRLRNVSSSHLSSQSHLTCPQNSLGGEGKIEERREGGEEGRERKPRN